MFASRGIVRVFVGAVATSFALAGCMRLPIGGPRVESLHGRIVTDAFVDDSAQIFSMNADGSHRVQLTSRSNNGDPAWSPNGKLIAFDSDRVNASHIFVMNADGSDAHDVSPNANCSAYPSFSPDGKTFAFAQYPDPDLRRRAGHLADGCRRIEPARDHEHSVGPRTATAFGA